MNELEALLTKYEKQEISRDNYLWALSVLIDTRAARMLDEREIENENDNTN
jgi:hypothetical protein